MFFNKLRSISILGCIFVLIIGTIVYIYGASQVKDFKKAGDGPSKEKILRVRLVYSLPVDPILIRSMADYDLSLILFRNWFQYDSGRKAIPGLISTWQFDSQSGRYTFHVDPKARWSNGDAIKAKEIVLSLNRDAVRSSNYWKTLNSIADLKSIRVIDDRTFTIAMRDRHPSDVFFQRLGAMAFGVVHPSDLDQNGRVKSNHISSGPYFLKSVSKEILLFERNSFYPSDNSRGPQFIQIKPIDRNFSLQDFIHQKTWENIIQTTTLLPREILREIEEKRIPFWTRGHDRVSLLTPSKTSAQNIELKHSILQALGNLLRDGDNSRFDFGVKLAKSLQPLGYPLYQELDFSQNLNFHFNNKEIRILALRGYSAEIHKALLDPLFHKIGIRAFWDERPIDEFMQLVLNTSEHDYSLFSFGVADPEPTTWMSLIFKGHFMEINSEDEIRLLDGSKLVDKEAQNNIYKKILKDIGERGSYLPLLHFSTLSIGNKNINFSEIDELDETVNYSKIIFE